MSERMESVLILGAGGFLGPRLVASAVDAGAERVIAASRAPGGGLSSRLRPGLELCPFDAATQAVEPLLDHIDPSSVLLSAALSRMADCASDEARASALNTELPDRTARWCAAHGARLIYVSTDLVFGDRLPPAEGFREADPVGPLSAYGRSKAAGEEAVLAARGNALVVRLPLLFGPSGALGAGASDALLAATARGRVPGLFSDEFRTPLDVRDAAAALIECLEHPLTGRLHVAGEERISRHDFGLRVLVARGVDETRARAAIPETTRDAVGSSSERAEDVSLDASLARRELTTRLRSIDEALADRSPVDSAP